MPNMWLEKVGIRLYCSHPDCEENPKFFLNTNKRGWRREMKAGVTVAVIQIGNATETYCPDCIDKIFGEMKRVFDKRLWVFR